MSASIPRYQNRISGDDHQFIRPKQRLNLFLNRQSFYVLVLVLRIQARREMWYPTYTRYSLHIGSLLLARSRR
jgi:hypothetical protein